MQQHSRWLALVVVIVGLQVVACGPAQATTASKSPPARVEPIAGADVKRVVLTDEKAATRLGIQTAPVRDERIARKRTVGGAVVLAPANDGVLVRVRPTISEANTVDRSQPALVLPLARRASSADTNPGTTSITRGLTARMVELPAGDPEGATGALHYLVESTQPGLAPGQPVLVELPLLGSGMLRKVIPHAAVIYDINGKAWTYTNPSPLAFVRQLISIDYIDGDLVVLQEGPPSGTAVVTVGVTELFGVETGIGK